MKKGVILIGAFCLISLGIEAQSKSETPYPLHTLKKVQQVQYEEAAYKPNSTRAGYNKTIVSKKVHERAIEDRVNKEKKAISKDGTPRRIVTKGVHQRNR